MVLEFVKFIYATLLPSINLTEKILILLYNIHISTNNNYF